MPLPSLAAAIVPELIEDAGNPVTVPEFANVTPDGIVYVSPESPIVADVPLAGDHLSAFISLLIYTPINFIAWKKHGI